MPDYPTSLCHTVSLPFNAFTISQMCLRIDCSLDICLFYCISKAHALEASVFFPASIDTQTNMKHIFKSIQRMKTFSLISLCVLQTKKHLQKCPLSRKLESHFENKTAAVLFLCWVLPICLMSPEKALWWRILFQTFFFEFFYEENALPLTKKSQIKLTFLGDVSEVICHSTSG